MPDLIIGTAGHIDHGKTQLVKALTGTDTDRLKEEKLRGITIELGFARFILPSGKSVSLIDVPGHERFIKTMLAGVAGIDAALLVIAADEGIMPQTREHLDILQLLEVKQLIVVINKIDLVEPEYLMLVQDEIKEFLENTVYQNSPSVNISALRGDGIEELKSILDTGLKTLISSKTKKGPARLPLDRVFTKQGFGTVATGTLFNGIIKVGDNLQEPLKDKKTKVRSLQVHDKSVEFAKAGQRVAINLTGLEPKDLTRGDVLATPDFLQASSRLDVSCYLLKSSPYSLLPHTRVRFHQGTREALGRIVLLDRQELSPGEQAMIQIYLEEPVAVIRGDHYIIRSYSPVHTIGGGRILEPLAIKHKNKNAKKHIRDLEIKATGDPEKLISLFLEKSGTLVTINEISRFLYWGIEDTQKIIKRLLNSKRIIAVPAGEDTYLCCEAALKRWAEFISQEIEKQLGNNLLELGLNKEQLRTRCFSSWTMKEFNALLGYLLQEKMFSLFDGQYLIPFAYRKKAENSWNERIEDIKKYFIGQRWIIPPWSKVVEEIGLDEKAGAQLLQYLLRTGNIISLGGELYLTLDLLEEAKKVLAANYASGEQFSVAEVRDLLNTTRKVVVPVLEYLDKLGYTIRRGEGRILAKK